MICSCTSNIATTNWAFIYFDFIAVEPTDEINLKTYPSDQTILQGIFFVYFVIKLTLENSYAVLLITISIQFSLDLGWKRYCYYLLMVLFYLSYPFFSKSINVSIFFKQ